MALKSIFGKVGRKRPIQAERKEQISLITWVKYMVHSIPELEMLFAIPNGGSRNIIEAANLKKSGVKSGVPDLFLSVAKSNLHGLYIEMKRPDGKGKLTESQKEFQKLAVKYNYGYVICDSWDIARKEILLYLGKKEVNN